MTDESERDPEFEIAKVKIPSVRLDKELLKSVCDLIEGEHEKVSSEPENTFYEIIYKRFGKVRDRESHTKENFLQLDLDKNLYNIYIYFGTKFKKITIWLHIFSLKDSDIEIKGVDIEWVDAKEVQFNRIFDKYRTRNNKVHGWQGIIISLVLAFIIGTLVSNLFDQPVGSALAILGWSFVYMSSFFWGIWLLLKQLYPKIEIEGSHWVRFRKKILGGLLGLPGVLFIEFIAKHFL